jgi:hypothetical protein
MRGFRGHGAGKDRHPPTASHHVVPVATSGRRKPIGVRGPVQNFETGRRPALHEFVGVHFGSAGLAIVEIAPGEHVDASHPTGDHLVDHRPQIAHGYSGAPTGTRNTAPGRRISL